MHKEGLVGGSFRKYRHNLYDSPNLFMAKFKSLLNKKEEVIIEYKTKNYKRVFGDCESCSLRKECKINGTAIKHFLKSLKIECSDGFTVIVVEN